ncbi:MULTISPECIES: sulfurtransferase TusA family protein [Aliivibrio]|uniref:Sulfurtransferase TusA family protein n=1 Tax=Aliivibrio finisterrensis TaxID=511998 RepID=A0A4Q5KUW6_9GAMM|nr:MULTISPECIES: sulfurtransferase TusA family protein [Aliivibrio]MDD9177821.1 sulfurtransferase TusA family protein [Aliivibrio sp. A6]RYU52061.1 sulfurtransferase TusA family protein [Aliivibrio finisterrensis]RYU53904.1 sulfurtransferase TusA family protein [Aliivibrio finisterrensis]RYU59111.1 sulfurtransferase TusA family protein [Aliivibrio finisterrensis]RYU65107.1 sulfurtransferase TusA family protein [Aliivibrio finisterrensis]
METRTLDLSQQRCPMSLLLAKRAAQRLDKNGKLEIKVVDKTSLADIMKYFELNAFAINVEHEASYAFLTVTRK